MGIHLLVKQPLLFWEDFPQGFWNLAEPEPEPQPQEH